MVVIPKTRIRGCMGQGGSNLYNLSPEHSTARWYIELVQKLTHNKVMLLKKHLQALNNTT